MKLLAAHSNQGELDKTDVKLLSVSPSEMSEALHKAAPAPEEYFSSQGR